MNIVPKVNFITTTKSLNYLYSHFYLNYVQQIVHFYYL